MDSKSIIAKYLDELIEKTKDIKNPIFRDQSESDWKIKSSSHRRFENNCKKDFIFIDEKFIQYNKDLIKKVKDYKIPTRKKPIRY